jgi:hypothetical protein
MGHQNAEARGLPQMSTIGCNRLQWLQQQLYLLTHWASAPIKRSMLGVEVARFLQRHIVTQRHLDALESCPAS